MPFINTYIYYHFQSALVVFDGCENGPSPKDESCQWILMLTAIKEKRGLDFKKEAGDKIWLPVDDYCEKPLKPEDLISKVNNLLNKK